MSTTTNRKNSTQKMVLAAILASLVFVLQFLAVGLRAFGLFSLNLSLIPIVIGAAICGIKVGGFLGLISGIAILLSGDAAPFLSVNFMGTVATVIAKGIACGVCAGITYKALIKANRYVAVVISAIVCPVVNTGVFLIGCGIFFMETLREWAAAGGYGDDMVKYIIVGLVGVNFLFELVSNIVLSPVVVRLINIKNKK